MTVLEAIQVRRADEQMATFPDRAEARRRVCQCGCGRWWYEPRHEGRPRSYASPDCFLRERNRRRRRSV